MSFSSHQAKGCREGGHANADIAALKGHSLSTVLLAHLSNAGGSELYRIFVSLQVSSRPRSPSNC